MESIVGQTVSHYAFLEKLGAGGMGEIYKARDSRLNRIVAVKVLTPGRTRDPERRRRFIQEAQAASALNHPNIITIHDILPEGDTQYMVMEYVSGKTLHAMIAGGRLPVPQVLQIATQMANALAAAHAAGIIHRDLKPANVMVTSSGLVKVLDFGLAKLTDPSGRLQSGDSSQTQDPVTLTAAPLTVEGSIMGTVNYMSPEQAEGMKVDARADIFSFGAVLYEMVTGQRAFDGDSGIQTLSAVLRDDVKPIRQFAPETPAELADLIVRCLRKNPADRWQSMTEVAAVLNRLRALSDLAPTPAPAASAIRGDLPTSTASAVPTATAPKAVAKETGSKKTGTKSVLVLAGTCAALVALAIGGAWWQTHRQVTAAPQPVAPVIASAPPASPTPPPAATEPQVAPETKNDSTDAVSSTAAPPPSAAVAPLGNKAKAPLPPPVVATTSPVQPKAALDSSVPPVVAPAPRAPATTDLVSVTLNDGVPFRIALMDDVLNTMQVGQALRFRVLDGLQSGDVVVIAKGAVVTGSIVSLGGKRNFFGERSKVKFRLVSAAAVDGSKIDVRATPMPKNDGDDTRPFEAPKGSKDKSLIAANGTEFVAYVAGDQTVHVHK